MSLQKGAFHTETAAVKLNDHQPLLIQLLSPEQVDAIVAYGFLFPIRFHLSFLKLFLMEYKQFFRIDGPFLKWMPSPWLAEPYFSKAVHALLALMITYIRAVPLSLRHPSFVEQALWESTCPTKAENPPRILATW